MVLVIIKAIYSVSDKTQQNSFAAFFFYIAHMQYRKKLDCSHHKSELRRLQASDATKLHACRDCDATIYNIHYTLWVQNATKFFLSLCIMVHQSLCVICSQCRQKATLLSRLQVNNAKKLHAEIANGTIINSTCYNRTHTNCKMQQNLTYLAYSIAQNSVLLLCCIASFACNVKTDKREQPGIWPNIQFHLDNR